MNNIDTINYLFTFSLSNWKEYEKKIKVDNINNFEENIDIFFENFSLNDLKIFLKYIYPLLLKTNIIDKGYTYFKILEYLFEVWKYQTNDIIYILKSEKNTFLSFNDGIYSYVMILFSFWWIENNYLLWNSILYFFIINELKIFENEIKSINQIKAEVNSYYNMLKNRNVWTTFSAAK